MTGGVCLVLATHLGSLSSQEEGVLRAHMLEPSMAHLVLQVRGFRGNTQIALSQ